ncbi:dharma [Astyanax mexicanus]|uniref:Homeobox protein goosecoid-like n=1 Tax=Astyanax mexicanus TaxID=7994 RepID=A0A8B9JGB8_ASTMX|nr:dharma [Astyanax mexicanus]KAG9265105.1 homeobox protein goosecoid-like [Astyanax mexicanus]
MDTSKFSNFSIDYILGESSSRPHTHTAEPPAAPQALRGDCGGVNLLPSSGFSAQSLGGAAVPPLPAPCPGTYVYDRAPYSTYNTFTCCGPVTYYQTSFNLNYCGTERWFHSHPDCDRDEAHCYQTGQQRQRNRIRTVFTENQTRQLDQLFSITEYPSVEARAELARNTGLSEEIVRVWFKNRRARRKRQRPSSDQSDQSV